MNLDGFYPGAPDAVFACPGCGALGAVDYGCDSDGSPVTYVDVLQHDERCPDYEPARECPF